MWKQWQGLEQQIVIMVIIFNQHYVSASNVLSTSYTLALNPLCETVCWLGHIRLQVTRFLVNLGCVVDRIHSLTAKCGGDNSRSVQRLGGTLENWALSIS